MAGIAQFTYFVGFSAVVVLVVAAVALAVSPAEMKASSIIRLPSAAAAAEEEGESVCAGKTRSAAKRSCPVKCFTTDPVCGVDGVTYWCGCAEAECAGKKVAKAGFCEVGSGGSGHLSGQALLLVHIVWLIVLAFSVCFGLF